MEIGKKEYWRHVMEKAGGNIHHVTDMDVSTECELKCAVEHTLRFGTCREKADVLVEAMEWMVAYHKLRHAEEAAEQR